MTDTTLAAEKGREQGSPASRRLRSQGRIPGVLYGHGMEPVSLSVDGKELRVALSGEAGTKALLMLDVEGTQQLAIAHAIQRHPVRGTVSHVDFLAVSRHEKLNVEVPVVLVGHAQDVERQGGLVEHVLTNLSILAPADSIPPAIEVDVSAMSLGQSLHLGDLTLPQGVETSVAADLVVAVAHAGRLEVEAEPESGAAAGEASGEAEAADQG